jgi:hypothetical protein
MNWTEYTQTLATISRRAQAEDNATIACFGSTRMGLSSRQARESFRATERNARAAREAALAALMATPKSDRGNPRP